MTKPSTKTGLLILALLLVIGDGVAAWLLKRGKPTPEELQWFGHVVAMGAILLLAILIAALRQRAITSQPLEAGQQRPSVRGVLIGADNRLSTSKLSAFAWTWVLAWAILSLAVADRAGLHEGWMAFLEQGIKDEYLVLLGGPFVALVGAKALVSNGLANGTQVRTQAEDSETTAAHRVSQAFSDDSGQTDLVDTQYLVFGAIALLVFVVMFLKSPTTGLPQVPETLIALSSLAATTYVANKWTARDAKPHIEQIVPNNAKPGTTVTVYGTNLLTVSIAGKRAPANEPLQVLFGTLAEQRVQPAGPEAKPGPTGSDYFRVTVPPVSEAALGSEGKCQLDVVVRNAIGVFSDNSFTFTIER